MNPNANGDSSFRVWSLLLLCVVVLIASGVESASAFHGWPRHKCGLFLNEDNIEGTTYYARVTVHNSDHLSCKTAMAVVEAFWNPEEDIVSHGGPSEVQIYYTMRRFPGWRCYTGAGGGGCLHRHRLAAYTAKST